METQGGALADKALFEKWAHAKIAGVVHGEKPAELLVIRSDRTAISMETRMGVLTGYARTFGLSDRLLYECPVGARVVVFDPDRVQQYLDRVPGEVLERLGFPPGIDTDGFLGEVERRWRGAGRIPDEIGLCLGYPLKDVLGFMGLNSLPPAGFCGWRIYGNPTRSLERRRDLDRARAEAQVFLNQ
jgi:hypothetical protein